MWFNKDGPFAQGAPRATGGVRCGQSPAVCIPPSANVQPSAWGPRRAMGGRKRLVTEASMSRCWGAGSPKPRPRRMVPWAAPGRGPPHMTHSWGGAKSPSVGAGRGRLAQKPRAALPPSRVARRLQSRPPSHPGRSRGGVREWEWGAAAVPTPPGVPEPLHAGGQRARGWRASRRWRTRRATGMGVVARPPGCTRRGRPWGASRGGVGGHRPGAGGRAAAVGGPTLPRGVLGPPGRHSGWRVTGMGAPPRGRGVALSPLAGPPQAGGRRQCWGPWRPARWWEGRGVRLGIRQGCGRRGRGRWGVARPVVA